MKKILAIIGIVILGGLYLSTLILAIIGTSYSIHLLKASIIATIVVPVFLYIWLYLIKIFKNKKPLDNEEDMIVFDNKTKIDFENKDAK